MRNIWEATKIEVKTDFKMDVMWSQWIEFVQKPVSFVET